MIYVFFYSQINVFNIYGLNLKLHSHFKLQWRPPRPPATCWRLTQQCELYEDHSKAASIEHKGQHHCGSNVHPSFRSLYTSLHHASAVRHNDVSCDAQWRHDMATQTGCSKQQKLAPASAGKPGWEDFV